MVPNRPISLAVWASKICKLYEENLRYFARKNVPMSCYRPIAPDLKNRIKEVEWEDIDPEKYPELFRRVVTKNKYLPGTSEEIIHHDLKSIRNDIAKKIRVFRRAKLSMIGRIRIKEPAAKAEPYWIIQYGINDISSENIKKPFKCTNRRGGFDNDLSDLRLYVVSENTMELTSTLGTVRRPSSEGQYLRQIDGRLFIENINKEGSIELNEIDTAMPLADTVCIYKFVKTSKRRN